MLAVGGNLYSVVQFEQPSPAAIYMMQLGVSSTSGDLTVIPGSVAPVNTSQFQGLWFPCAGVTSPWQARSSQLPAASSPGARKQSL